MTSLPSTDVPEIQEKKTPIYYVITYLFFHEWFSLEQDVTDSELVVLNP